MAIAVSIPIFLKMKMHVKPTKPVKMLYNYIQKLEPKDSIMIAFDYSPDSLAELQPMAKVLLYHAFKKDVRVIGLALAWPSGSGLGLEAMQGIASKYNFKMLKNNLTEIMNNPAIRKWVKEKKYKIKNAEENISNFIVAKFENDKNTLSVNKELMNIFTKNNLFSGIDSSKLKLVGRDWVYFGYKPGYVSIILGMGGDIVKTIQTDYKGTSLTEYDMFTNPTTKIKNYDNIAVVIDLAAGGSPGTWITYVNTKFGRPVATGVTAVMAADFYPYLQSKQLIGLLNGMRGAADYETLTNYEKFNGKLGLGLQGMGSQTFAHFLIILFIILGNIGYLASKKNGGNNE